MEVLVLVLYGKPYNPGSSRLSPFRSSGGSGIIPVLAGEPSTPGIKQAFLFLLMVVVLVVAQVVVQVVVIVVVVLGGDVPWSLVMVFGGCLWW